MKIFYQSILFLFLGVISISSFAQRNCGTMESLEYRNNIDPQTEDMLRSIEEHTSSVLANANRAVEGVITIPTVVHVVYNGSTENISDAQIMTQINVLNEDFRRLNADANSTWSQGADSEIEFCLASVDPNGVSTTGITRTSTSSTSFGTNDNMKFNSSGGKDAWPASDYLNIWVCDISGGILGYAQFPGGSDATDGVVCDYQYFGTIGTASSPFDLGRTTTHEVGHWLNLRHIWGDGGCGVDDFVSDTPESDGANYGCATGHSSCGTTDMVENYMDYSDDACMNLYTVGQRERMRALFEPGGSKASLLSSNGCGNGTTPTCDDGIQNGTETGIDCGGSCDPCDTTCDGTEVTLTITFDNYPEETSWLIIQGGATIASGGTYGSQADGSTLTEAICLQDGCFDFVINDAYGDGICCSYGNGSYSLTNAGTTLVSGSSFTNSETTNFCIGSVEPTCNDGVMNGDETGIDCGGSCDACPTCDDGIMNGDETGIDCGGSCNPCPTCDDGIMNGDETDVDCGGSCDACPTCDDGIMNGDETGVDCGGSCDPCTSSCDGTEVTLTITFDNYPEETSWSIVQGGATVASGGTYGSQADGSTLTETICMQDGCFDFIINDTYGDGICCSYGNGSYSLTDGGATLVSGGSFTNTETTNFCIGAIAPTCTDGIMNGDETGIDCGGSCDPCPTCTDGIMNGDETDVDCGGSCDACPTCDDGIMNGDETGVDCGGSCDPCPTCTDGIMNGDETGIDCGGSCDPCSTCTDGIMNGDETGIDCGGSCDPCSTCTDGIMNGDETGVDCGGSCDPCSTGCNATEVTITIVFDNYPEETSWYLKQGAIVVASGGTYGNQADGSTFTEVVCLEDKCYEFVIKDTYGDGICCSYGNGSYSVASSSVTYASGGSFGSSEITNFCVGELPDPTCDDGIMNGEETGVDCGGSSCEPCSTSCNYVDIDVNDFDSNWGIWNDGGSDCRRSTNDAAYANSGTRCVRLRDNTGSSAMTTDNMNLTSYEEITVAFNYYARSMESGEDFWLQASTDGGATYSTLASWVSGVDFNNDQRYFESVVVTGTFSANSRFRFKCDASTNSDYVYIDDVVISGCLNINTRQEEVEIVEESLETIVKTTENISELVLYPNPVTDELWIQFDAYQLQDVKMFVTDLSGKVMHSREFEVKEGLNKMQLNSSDYSAGIYFVHLSTDLGIESKRFVVMK